jgi:hypothetical protein
MYSVRNAHAMRRSAAAALTAVVLAAVTLRVAPLFRSLYWGADFGEYVVLTARLVAQGRIVTPYVGWGATYPYFPAMFFLSGGVAFGGVSVPAATAFVAPVLGALSVLVVFFLAAQILRHDGYALLAAAFVAVAMPHVYATSHAIPGTVGDLLLVTGLLFVLRARRDPRWYLLLVPLAAALLTAHHFAAYVLVLAVLFGLFLDGLRRPTTGGSARRREAVFLVGLAVAAVAYWLGYAETFQRQILRSVPVDPWWLPFPALAVLGAVLWAVVRVRRRVLWPYRPRYPSRRGAVAGFGIGLVATYAILLAVVFLPVPGTSIRLDPNLAWYLAPLLVLFAFAAAGRKVLDFARDGTDPTAWFLALLFSVVVGAVVAPVVLIPYRHAEYLMVPLALFAAPGMHRLLLAAREVPLRTAGAVVVVALFVGAAAGAYPPPNLLAGYDEGIPPEAVAAAFWIGGNGRGLLAADHRASMLAFGLGGMNATWDRAPRTLRAPSFEEAMEEMGSVDAPAGRLRVTYVQLDRGAVAGAQFTPFEAAEPLDAAAVAKFLDPPFMKVYADGYGQLFWVNWGCTEGAACP